MTRRRRRSPEEARTEILDAAERLLVTEGLKALTLQNVAREVGISHPGVLHHFHSTDRLAQALHERVSRRIRGDFLALTNPNESLDRTAAIHRALAALADPHKGRLLAWLVASGRDPFPEAAETGLSQIADALAQPGSDPEEVRHKLMLMVLAMVGESLVGAAVRERLGMSDSDPERFRTWLLERVVSGPKTGE
jgi:AcrR family transcriptional regulator